MDNNWVSENICNDAGRYSPEYNVFDLSWNVNYLTWEFCQSYAAQQNEITRYQSSATYDPNANPCDGDPTRSPEPIGGEGPNTAYVTNSMYYHFGICGDYNNPQSFITRMQMSNDGGDLDPCDYVSRYRVEGYTFDASWGQVTPCPDCQNGAVCNDYGGGCCTCGYGWSGCDCSTPVCSTPCQNSAWCSGVDYCTCQYGWTGANTGCTTPTCANPCVHGSCTAPDQCSCSAGWIGDQCQTDCGATYCSGQGTCNVAGQCACNGNTDPSTSCSTCLPNYYNWPSCTYCDAAMCNYNGNCDGSGQCSCNAGFDPATNCGSCLPNYYNYPYCSYCDSETCNNHGSCTSQGLCNCDATYDVSTNCSGCSANRYNPPSCTYCDTATCNNQGTCNSQGLCKCNSVGLDASTNCSTCLGNYYNAPACTYCVASLTCAGKGTCDTSTGGCDCTPGYDPASNCQACATDYYNYPSCSYCSASSTCKSHGTCSGAGQCLCNDGFSLSTNCSTCATNYYNYPLCTYCDISTCNNQGQCNQNGLCSCNANLDSSTNCSTCLQNFYNYPKCTYCTDSMCNGHGKCDKSTGMCACDAGFDPSSNCSKCAASHFNFPQCTFCNASMCNNIGQCSNTTGLCICPANYDSSHNCTTCAKNYYSYPICAYCGPDTCNGHGNCSATGACKCAVGYDNITSCGSCSTGYYGYPNCSFASPPSSPQNVTSVAQHYNLTLTWLPPKTIGYANLSGYAVDMFNQSFWTSKYRGNATTLQLGNLQANVTYNLRVAAISAIGTGAYAYVNQTTVPTGPPTMPTGITRKEYTRSFINITWGLPSDDGGFPILYYTLKMLPLSSAPNKRSTNASTWMEMNVTGSQASIVSLSPGSMYSFYLAAVNKLGVGPYSPGINFTTAQISCGDSVCDPNENCSTCFLDCSACGYGSCGGTPSCSGNGNCTKGVCDCKGAWYGDTCQYSVDVPIDIIPNKTSPIVDINLGDQADVSETGNVVFSLEFTTIQEVDTNNKVVASYPLNLHSLNLSQTLNGTTSIFTYSILLPNGASINLTISYFRNATVLTFANQPVQIAKNGIKYAMKLVNWPFVTVTNRLLVTMHTGVQSTSGCETSTSANTDDSNNLRTILIEVNGVALYGKFMEYAYFDDIVRVVKFDYNATSGDVIIEVPHFWDYAAFDPDFQVLLDPGKVTNTCGQIKHSKGVPGRVVGGVVGGVLGAAAVAAVAIFAVNKHKQNERERALGGGGLESSTSQTGFLKRLSSYRPSKRRSTMNKSASDDQL